MKKIVFAFCAVIFAAGCNDSSDAKLSEGEYKYISGSDKSAEITISFDTKEKRFYGMSGVNRYFGTYEQDGSKLAFSPIGSTMMAGPENLMKAERIYLDELSEVSGFKNEGAELILKTKKDTRLTFKKVE